MYWKLTSRRWAQVSWCSRQEVPRCAIHISIGDFFLGLSQPRWVGLPATLIPRTLRVVLPDLSQVDAVVLGAERRELVRALRHVAHHSMIVNRSSRVSLGSCVFTRSTISSRKGRVLHVGDQVRARVLRGREVLPEERQISGQQLRRPRVVDSPCG